VLQPAVAVVHRVEHEDILPVRRLAAQVPEADLGLADLAGIIQQLLPVERGQRAGHHKAVGHTTGGECTAPERAQLEGVVHQAVVVVRAVAAKSTFIRLHGRQAGGHLPAPGGAGGCEGQFVGLVLLAPDLQAQAGAVEEAPVGVQPGGAHRVVQRIHLVFQHQGLPVGTVGPPARLVQLLECYGLAALAGRQFLQVLGEFAHQVAAGNPDRQGHLLPCCGAGDGQGDAEQVRMQIGRGDPVVQWGGCGGRCRRTLGHAARLYASKCPGIQSEVRSTSALPANTAELAWPGRWCCPLQGGWRSDTQCAKPGGVPISHWRGVAPPGRMSVRRERACRRQTPGWGCR